MKSSATLLCLLLAVSLAFSQTPVNDNCTGLIDLGILPYCSAPAQYTNVNATASVIDVPAANVPSCFTNGASRDVWFQFTPPADGSILDIEITVLGNTGGNGTMKNPQVAVYRGDCQFGGLAELDCAVAPANSNEVRLQLFGLTAGLPYYLRINDFSATPTPNSGTFKLCIEKFNPEIIMGTVPSSGSCTGTLWDSGGPDGDYDTYEDLTFTICPQEAHQCIILNVENYATEYAYDFLAFYEGNNTTGLLLTQLTGADNNFQVQIPAPCATIRFSSDDITEDAGFKITWTCSQDACTAAPPTTCYDPAAIPALPYQQNGLSNCLSGNTINNGPCNDDFLVGNEYIFTYTSPGDECIKIATAGTLTGAGIAIYNECPGIPGAACITSDGGNPDSENPSIAAAFLENPDTYYIVFGAGFICSPFDIAIDTVTCPVVVPSAARCENALNLIGCSNKTPEIIALQPGAGDPDFITPDVNQGCFVLPNLNYTFFYFQAAADGKFGFAVQAADTLESSDIDFNVWGPIDNVDAICDFVSSNQPVRSSWASGDDLTGLADVHPLFGTPVDDEFDCGSPETPDIDPPPPAPPADDFVRRLDVQKGKVYVVLLDDFGSAIQKGGISIDFSGTTEGVLDVPDDLIKVSSDTAVCSGRPVQLSASGGAAYYWSPETGLSCSVCPNPVATPTKTTSYNVQVPTACNVYTRVVKLETIELDLGPDITVCNNASFTLNKNGYQGDQYTWTGPAGLSCYDCPSPEVSGLATGMYIYIATLVTPDCTVKDTIKITVANGQQPQYNITADKAICAGQTINLGGAASPNTFYQWTSQPSGFSASGPNPSATPQQTTTYYLVAFNTSCAYVSVDSVKITVFQQPALDLQGDTAICNGESVLLGHTIPEPGVTYSWTPDNGTLNDINVANPVATPQQTTVYQISATNAGCTTNKSVQVSVVNLNLSLNVGDTVRICQGTPADIQATVTPPGGNLTWSPLTGLQLSPNGQNATALPEESTLYTVTATVPGCIRKATVFVQVDSLPQDLHILPEDTTVCQGSLVLLSSPVYEPANFPIINFFWEGLGQLTPDSLYNVVVQPDSTLTYRRITRSGVCVDTAEATVHVIIPPEMQVVPADTLVCAGESVVLKVIYAPGVTEIMWSPANSLSCDDCDSPVATPPGTTVYTVSGKYQNCPVDATGTVQVRNLPPIQFPNDTQLCEGQSVTLNQAYDPGSTYTWTSTDPSFVPGNNPTVTPTLPSTTYSVTAFNGCTNQGQVTITIASATLAVDGDTTVCKNSPVPLTASGTLPGTYTWSTGQNGQSVQVQPGATTTYTVVYTYGGDCQLTGQVTVNVQEAEPAVQFPNDTELCPGDSVTINLASTPGATYSWTSTPPGFTFNGAIPPVQAPGQSIQYNLTATLGLCTINRSVNITVYNATLAMPADVTICAGESVQLAANGSLSGTYLWSTGETTATINPTPPKGMTTYDLIYTYGQDCILEDAVKVTVVDSFTVKIVTDPDTNSINIGDAISLMAIVSPSQNLSNFQFQWFENGSTAIGTGESIDVVPSTNDTTVIYKVVATSPGGCTKEFQVVLTLVQPAVVVPNAFTPNDDGVNDVFRMKILEGSATILGMDIFNRWGQKVYTSTDPDAVWDGKMDNGKDAPSDVYAYIIRWQRGDGALQPPKKGEVALLR